MGQQPSQSVEDERKRYDTKWEEREVGKKKGERKKESYVNNTRSGNKRMLGR